MATYKKIIVYTDGGSRGNPGKAAIGVLVKDENGQDLAEHAECIGIATNNQAEYKALIKALEIASRFTKNEVHCFCDSELAVRQATGFYKTKNRQLNTLLKDLKKKENNFKKVVYGNLPRENKFIRYVDGILNKELDKILISTM